MVHMERETILGRLMGRRNGKTVTSPSQDEAAARRQDRREAALYRRRYEFPDGARTGGAQAKVTCPHLRQVWFQVEHPRYGEDVPMFQSTLRRLKPGKHQCVAGASA